jgi:hypothetical protein
LLRSHLLTASTSILIWITTFDTHYFWVISLARQVEGAKLKRMYAELELENAAIKDVPNPHPWRFGTEQVVLHGWITASWWRT